MKSVGRSFGPRQLALAVLALALAVRLWNLSARSLWFDEAVEYWVATAPFAQIPATVRDVLQDPPLYSFLLHLWMQHDVGEAWLRLPSVVFGVGAVLGVMVIGYRLQGWATALAAGFLMAILPTAVRYSQEVGQYAPMQCLVAWNLAVLAGLVHNPARGGFVRWTVLAAAAAWTYYGTVIPILVPFLFLLFDALRTDDRVRVKRAAIALGAFVASTLPLTVWFLRHQLKRGPTENALATAPLSVLEGARNVFEKIPEAIAFPLTGWPCSRIPVVVTMIVFVALAAVAFRLQRRFGVWVAATLLAYAVIGVLNVYPFGARYATIMTPLFVPLLACAISSVGPQRTGVHVAFTILCVACVISLPNRDLYRRVFGEGKCIWPETEDVAPVAKYWYEHRRPDQATYVYYGAAPAFAYYVDRLSNRSEPREPDWFLACWRGDRTGSCLENRVYYGRWTRPMPPEEKLASVYDTLGGMPAEFWLVTAHAQSQEDIVIGKLLQRDYVFDEVSAGRDAVAVLMKRTTK